MFLTADLLLRNGMKERITKLSFLVRAVEVQIPAVTSSRMFLGLNIHWGKKNRTSRSLLTLKQLTLPP